MVDVRAWGVNEESENKGVCERKTLVDRSEEAFSGRICMEDIV
jgi:hypothetical protein